MSQKLDVFIVGSKGIPARYGGFETFVDELTQRRKNQDINYYVACMNADTKSKTFMVNQATCFNINVPNIGSAKALLYDMKALRASLNYIKEHNIDSPIVYVLACRIGPFINHYKKELAKYNGTLLINPDGHEWKRAKWNAAIRRYWKISERLMVKHADLLVCDSEGIESYIQHDYRSYQPNTTFISYGSYIAKQSNTKNTKLDEWLKRFDIERNQYYLVVGRFVPENNLETILKEFKLSKTNKQLVIISNVEQNKFYKELLQKTHFDNDKRIKFVGTVYDAELLTAIRCNAFAYIHGHSVGGTNPSLLEALGSTKMNLLFDVNFNKEVAREGALYWSKDHGSLSGLIEQVETLPESAIDSYERIAKYRITSSYSWESIVDQYETLFVKVQKS
jgi:rhamnosyltransferase